MQSYPSAHTYARPRPYLLNAGYQKDHRVDEVWLESLIGVHLRKIQRKRQRGMRRHRKRREERKRARNKRGILEKRRNAEKNRAKDI